MASKRLEIHVVAKADKRERQFITLARLAALLPELRSRNPSLPVPSQTQVDLGPDKRGCGNADLPNNSRL